MPAEHKAVCGLKIQARGPATLKKAFIKHCDECRRCAQYEALRFRGFNDMTGPAIPSLVVLMDRARDLIRNPESFGSLAIMDIREDLEACEKAIKAVKDVCDNPPTGGKPPRKRK